MDLATITPVVLTQNEVLNLPRMLGRLQWASEIIVIDSFSTDRTLEIARSNPRVRVIQREFDNFASQCNEALRHVATDWVLSCDADYLCSPELINEISRLAESPMEAGFEVPFRYCIRGKALRGTLYPPRVVLYRRDAATYEKDGHAHRVRISGTVGRLHGHIDHDDRKPLATWLASQEKYANAELEKLLNVSRQTLSRTDRLRRTGWLVPLLTPFYCLFVKGLVLNGMEGWIYTWERTYAEVLLAMKVLRCLSTDSQADDFER